VLYAGKKNGGDERKEALPDERKFTGAGLTSTGESDQKKKKDFSWLKKSQSG